MNERNTSRETDLDRLSRLKALSWLSPAELTLLVGALVLANHKRHSVILREVSLVIPDDVTLVQLSLTAPTAASIGPAATPGFVIQGSAFSYDSVARLLSRLALVPDLSNVTLTNTSSGGLGSGATPAAGVQFNITAQVKDPAVAAAAAAAAAALIPPPSDTTTTTG